MFYLTKIKSYEEESKANLGKAFVAEVSKYEVKELLEKIREYIIPKHIKRIKKSNSDDKVLVIVGMEHDVERIFPEVSGTYKIVEVLIPTNRPITFEQNLEHQKHWPCYFYGINERDNDLSYLEKAIKSLVSACRDLKKAVCSGVCILAKDGEVVEVSFDDLSILGHSVFKCVSKVSRRKHSYLCTGFDAFIYSEPCISCAMAFVHGRISKVFFLKAISNGPYSSLKLCYNKSLNHRYKVYKIDQESSIIINQNL